MLFNEAWFVHGLNDEVDLLAQQLDQQTRGAVRLKDGVVGKSWPFNIIAPARMSPVARDSDTVYINPAQTKRRAALVDRGVAALIDDFDVVKTPADIDTAILETLAAARNREKDIIALTAAIGTAVTVDEAGETTGTQALPTTGGPLGIGQYIVDGGTGFTLSKIIQTAELMNANNVPMPDRYYGYSAHAFTNLLQNTQFTSSDYNTIRALNQGTLPFDETWMGFKWRMVTGFIDVAQTVPILPKTGSIRSCIAWQKNGLGVAVGLNPSVQTSQAPHKWNNQQIILKLSMGAVRIQDTYVVKCDIDETQ